MVPSKATEQNYILARLSATFAQADTHDGEWEAAQRMIDYARQFWLQVEWEQVEKQGAH